METADADALFEAKRRIVEQYGEPLETIYVTIFVNKGTFLLSENGEGFIHPETWHRILVALEEEQAGFVEEPKGPVDTVSGVEVIEDDAGAAKAIAEAYGIAQQRTGRIDPGYKKNPPGGPDRGAGREASLE